MREEQKGTDAEEFSILNDLVNRLLKNLQVTLSDLSIRLSFLDECNSKEMNFPTLMLRIKEAHYFKTYEEESTEDRSDLALILNNKELTINTISLHLLESWTLHSNELSRNP